jgi:2-hydroxy-6-oxonona-2,4-dienedioate hydrolase
MENEITTLLIDLALGHYYLLPEAIRANVPPPMPAHNVVSLYGQPVIYFESGEGANVIFLHGLGGEASNWTANFYPISDYYHVYAIDQIGFGGSAKPPIEYKIQTFVDFLEAFMKELEIPKATIVGNSLGGWIATEFAVQHPAMMNKLVLVDAAGLTPGRRSDLPADLGRGSLLGTRNTLNLIFYRKNLVSDEVVKRAFTHHMKVGDGFTRQRTLAGIVLSNQFEDEKLHNIHVPTLLIWGRNDKVTPLSLGERFQRGIRDATLVILENCGHIPQVESPGTFNKTLLDFLNSAPVG